MENPEQEEVYLIRESNSRESMVSITLGRALTTLLSFRTRKLHHSISRLSSTTSPSRGPLEDSLWFLHTYVKDAAERKLNLDEILIPLIQHWLRNRDMKRGGQAVILLNWLFQDEFLFQFVVHNLAEVIVRKDDRYVALGWCILVRVLVEDECSMDEYSLNGVKDNYDTLLKRISWCIPRLLQIVCEGSTVQDGYELPSRLSLSAADCIIAVSEGLTRKNKVSSSKPELVSSKGGDSGVSLVPAGMRKKRDSLSRKSSEVFNFEMAYLLWDQIDGLIALLEKLCTWSGRSRPLHAKGVELVLKWLRELKRQYGRIQDEIGENTVKQRSLLLSSCWKHYSILLHLEDHKFSEHCNELLDQYVAGIKHYTDNHAGEHKEDSISAVETRKFFLNCLCLLLGRLDTKKFGSVVSEYWMQISPILLSQLRSADDDAVAAAVCIFKAAVLKPVNSHGSGFTDNQQMEALLPLLLQLLDERDGTARAVVLLIAEYCSMSGDSQCLKQLLGCLASRNVNQRRNAIDAIFEFVGMIQNSVDRLSSMTWQAIMDKVIDCLADHEITIREQASTVLSKIDPSLGLPAIVHLIYSSDELVQTSACSALIGMLKYHKNEHDVICLLVDCLGNLSQRENTVVEKGSKLDADRVFKLVSEWSDSVEDWNSLIGPLVNKLFAEPANATIVRFLSCISEHLAECADTVLYHVLSRMKQQKKLDGKEFSKEETEKMQLLFERLSPLLVIRLLPLRVFDDVNSSMMYGQLLNLGNINTIDQECVTAFLFKRSFDASEFEDVRKLAAELCGRVHPKVLFPVVSSALENATGFRDIQKIKACLFSVCTSLVVRGNHSISHPSTLNVRDAVEKILMWPSFDGDEVSKAQHGCIDCLALMICAELQALKTFSDTSQMYNAVGNDHGATSENRFLNYVISQLIGDEDQVASASTSGREDSEVNMPVPHSFRLCMANVLISVCQKISDSGKKRLAQKMMPCLMHSVETLVYPEIRAACIQVLFSAVYHLKSAVAPYSSGLLKLSLESLKNGSEKERMAGAKLMASLMASEELILERISGGLLEARSLLSSIYSSGDSIELQQICKKLLSCLSSA